MKKIFSILLASIAMTSCVDTVILPDNKTVDDDFWQKKGEVEAVVATAYAQLRDAAAIRNMIVWGDFRSDELSIPSTVPATSAYKTSLSQIYSMNIETENAFTSWYPFYSAINYCNLVLEKGEGVIALDPDYTRGDFDANRAQVLALRAFCYFYLTRVFHDIPVTPHAYLNSSDNLNVPQYTPDSVLTMCIDDLVAAEKVAVSGSTYGDWRDKGYLNKDGINAILADIYLWRASINRSESDYQTCVDYCDKVIKAKKEAYEADPRNRRFGDTDTEQEYYLSDCTNMYYDIFGRQNADESIFELQFRNSNVANAGIDAMYFRYTGTNASTPAYLNATTAYGTISSSGKTMWSNDKDQRLYEYVYNAKATADQFPVRKFVAQESAGVSTVDGNRSARNVYQNWIFYRLTDVMLMKAEALVQIYNMRVQAAKDANDGTTVSDSLNQVAFNICQFVNDRALPEASKPGLSLKYNVYRDNMEQLVLAERGRELCFEGKRWFDLMRYNYRHTTTKADLTKKLTESYITNSNDFFDLALSKYPVPASMRAKMRDERYLYMPINQSEVELNPLLVQNPVYKSAAKY